jgi:hypothetical protein
VFDRTVPVALAAALAQSPRIRVVSPEQIARALVRLRRSHPGVHRPFRVPGGHAGAWIVSALATGWCALAFAAILWPGLGAANADAYLPEGFAGDRFGFFLVELVPIAAILFGAVAFAGLGRRGERDARHRHP